MKKCDRQSQGEICVGVESIRMARTNDDVGDTSHLEGHVGIEVVGLEHDN